MQRSSTRGDRPRRLGTSRRGPRLTGTGRHGHRQTPTFQEFHASTYKDTDNQYIVDGDVPVANTGQLQEFYDRLVGPETHGATASIVNTVGGADDKWTNAQVGNLTYCVSSKFGTRKADIVNAMNSGAGLWEAAAPRINFVYVPSQDANCTTRNKSVRVLGRARPDLAVHRPRVLPEHARSARATSWSTTRSGPRAPGRRPTSSATSSATRSASATSTRVPSPAPASRTTTGAR